MCLPSGKCNCAVYLKEGIFLEQPLGTGKYSHRFRKKKKERERQSYCEVAREKFISKPVS